ncbi:hypothetical protein [Glutamicibacter sp. JC586]|uniref:hypothetical protein n=1 Tax=Glutamicibacter sp. JC586 TaxID=2590552 RepID=UPI001359A75F|nr:hypothetical protein [Glutamicibacter sp. JC586]
MKPRTLALTTPALLAAMLTLASPASADVVLPEPTDPAESMVLMEVGTGKILGHFVPSQWNTVVEMDVRTGRIQQVTKCNEWQDTKTPDACVGTVTGAVPLLPANLAGFLGLV